MKPAQERRAFLKGMAAASALALAPAGAEPQPKADGEGGASPKSLPMRTLGRTGRQVTVLGLGGLFTVSMHDRHEQAVEIVNRALDLGINLH